MSATIHSLPPELLDHILDLVRGPGSPWTCGEKPKNADLLAAALVCRMWAETAQRVLCRDARIAEAVAAPFGLSQGFKYPVQHLWTAIRGLLSTSDATSWVEAALEKTSGNLKRLNLEYCQEVVDPEDLDTPFPFNLTHLGLTLYITPLSSHLLDALFSSCRDTLISLRLTITCDEDWDGLRSLVEHVEHVARQLERLDLDFRTDYDMAPPPVAQLAAYTDLTHFTKLKHLGVYITEKQFDGDFNPIALCLQQVPPPATLTHLTIGILDPSSVKQITDQLSIPALEDLERIDLVSLDVGDLEAAKEGVKLIDECEERGIRLFFRQDLL